jgi:hypothetical protein
LISGCANNTWTGPAARQIASCDIAEVAAPVVREIQLARHHRRDRRRRRHHDQLRLDLLRGKEAFVLAEVVRHDRQALGRHMDRDFGRRGSAMRRLQLQQQSQNNQRIANKAS